MAKHSRGRPDKKLRTVDQKPVVTVRTHEAKAGVLERFGRIDELDRSFDIEYWQRQGDAAIFRAAWDLVEFYWRDQGMDPDELRLQKSVEAFQPF
jgi:hypothetical protein